MASQAGTVGATVAPGAAKAGASRYYLRFDRVDRMMHALLMITFIGCTITGLPPLFSDHAWASALAHLLGGFTTASLIHRICAGIMIFVFASHVLRVFYDAVSKVGLLATLWGPKSMTPQPQDIIDMYRHVMWFIGQGPRPRFDRYTYWEKFDYWAVFWGMFIIGGSGLMLWFPHLFTLVLPGWVFNIATVIHGEEALLAVGFIFTFHFFNGHLRPAKFPMDTAIFTGRVSEHEMKDERAVEYARLVQEGRLDAREAPAPTEESRWFGWVVGGTALALGIVAIVLIVYSLFS
jgi:cytochrome b subunit of formate dehydrogenase